MVCKEDTLCQKRSGRDQKKKISAHINQYVRKSQSPSLVSKTYFKIRIEIWTGKRTRGVRGSLRWEIVRQHSPGASVPQGQLSLLRFHVHF